MLPPPAPEVVSRELCHSAWAARALRRLLAETARDTGAAEATLWVLDEPGEHLEAAVNHGPTAGTVEQLRVPVAKSVVGRVASTGIAEAIGPGEWHNDTIDDATGTDTIAMVASPVRLGDEVCGVLSAINPGTGDVFSGDALHSLEWKAYLTGCVLAELRRGG